MTRCAHLLRPDRQGGQLLLREARYQDVHGSVCVHETYASVAHDYIAVRPSVVGTSPRPESTLSTLISLSPFLTTHNTILPAYISNITPTLIHTSTIPSTTTHTRTMKSIQTYMNILKKTSGGQLAPTSTHTRFGRFSIRGLKAIKKTKKNMNGGQWAPAMTPAKLGRPQREPHPDPYYGHERTAKMSARFIHDLFKCSNTFCDGGIPDNTYPTLDEFIAYALFRSNSDIHVHYYAMYLIWRIHIKHPEMRAHHSHDTYLAALMVAKRMVSPRDYASESWSEVGQSIYSLARLADNEQRLCKMVGWEVDVNVTRVGMIEEQIEMKYAEPETPLESESSDEWDGSDDSSSLLSIETPDTSPLPSDSDSSPPSRSMPVGECVWW
ncbi:hypothetical protein OPQ81_009223 [Rhizoctonia solani]|nr:hypothetical protein OPQ81_009223 [Rhizoctonia solani]